MRRSTLNPNAFMKNKFRLIVAGLEPANAAMSIGDLSSEVGKIEREDKTRVSAGRTSGGDVDIVVDLADDAARDAYIQWYEQAIDGAGNTSDDSLSIDSDEINGAAVGINENYKREAILIKHRSYQSSQTQEKPLKVRLIGAWCTKYTITGGDMNAEETDKITLSISYDDMKTIHSQAFG